MEHKWVDVPWNSSENGELQGSNHYEYYSDLQDRVDTDSSHREVHSERFLGTVYDNDLTKSN